MVYADYTFYQTEYGGSAISEEAYPALSLRAAAFINMATSGAAKRATGDTLYQVKMANCALAEIYQDETRITSSAFSTEGSVQSETVGNWSRTYGSRAFSAADAEMFAQRRKDALALWLGGTGLLKVRAVPRCQAPCSRMW